MRPVSYTHLSLLFAVSLWVCGSFSVGVTGILALVIAVVMGATDYKAVFSGFGVSVVFYVIAIFALPALLLKTCLLYTSPGAAQQVVVEILLGIPGPMVAAGEAVAQLVDDALVRLALAQRLHGLRDGAERVGLVPGDADALREARGGQQHVGAGERRGGEEQVHHHVELHLLQRRQDALGLEMCIRDRSSASSKNTAARLSASWYTKSSPSTCQENGSCWNTESAEDCTTR